MIISEETRLAIQKTYQFLLDQYLQECEPEIDYAPYGNGYVQSSYDYIDEDIDWAKEKVCHEIKKDFEDYNNWICEDEFPEPSKYEEAKNLIIKYVEGL